MEPGAELAPEGAVGGDLPQQLDSLDLGDVPGDAVGNLTHDIDSDPFDTLLSVVSDLASQVDATQRRLDTLLSILLAQATDTGAVMPPPSSGAISKHPECAPGHSCAASAGFCRISRRYQSGCAGYQHGGFHGHSYPR
jgi:hypothetical protein